jgi:hypothetical protein
VEMPFFASRAYLWGLVYSAKLNGKVAVILIPLSFFERK